MKMTFTVWAYWQWAKLKCAALEVKMVREVAEWLAYIIKEIRNPDRDFIPELNLPGLSLSFEAQVTGTRKEKRKRR